MNSDALQDSILQQLGLKVPFWERPERKPSRLPAKSLLPSDGPAKSFATSQRELGHAKARSCFERCCKRFAAPTLKRIVSKSAII